MRTPPDHPTGRLFDSLRWNFVLIGGMGIAGLIVLGILAGNLAYGTLMEAERLHLEETAHMAANSMERALSDTEINNPDHTVLQQTVTELKKNTRFRFTLILNEGTVIADSNADPRYMENHAGRPEVALALAGHPDFELRYSHTLGMDTLYFARQWKGMVLRTAMPLHFIVPLFASVLAVVLTVCSISVFVMLVVSWRMYRRINIPMHQILRAARSWQNGTEPLPLYIKKPSELADIARALKRMAEELKSQVVDARLREQELQYLFKAIREAVLVVDQNQIIYRYNDSARNFIAQREGTVVSAEHDPILGMHLLTFIRSSELAAMVSECDNTATPLSAKISLYGSEIDQLSVYVAPLAFAEQEGQRLFILVLYLN